MGVMDISVLLIDIADSRRLWEHADTAFKEAVQTYEEISREKARTFGGTVVKPLGEGDSLFVVFEQAVSAVRCGVEILRAMNAEVTPIDSRVGFRVAVNCGEVHEREGDYFGSVVNRCARMRAICAGGQFLASESVAARCSSCVANDFTLKSLGQCVLRDFGAEEIWQVWADGLPQHFEPVEGTIVRNRSNLPVLAASFIGRTEDTDILKKSLLSGRLVTLLGSAGTGKTSLAIKVCASLNSAFVDGVWYAELASIATPELVVLSVMTSLKVHEDSDLTADRSLADAIGPRSLLLVWDNCEHVSAECARLATFLLQQCPNLKILATSREVLHADGEDVYRLSGLRLPVAHDRFDGAVEPPESVRLFVERAASVQPGYALSPVNYSAIAEICRRLDGIPLAIELAAARIRTMSARQIAERLGDRLRLLSTSNTSGLPHQRTLRSAIDWSYQLFTAEERELFCLLSLFAATWEPGAVYALCEGWQSPEAVDLVLESLAGKSMLTFTPYEFRYSMLESVRHFAAERVRELREARAIIQLQWQLVRYYAERANTYVEMLIDERQVDGLRWLDAEVDNLRSLLAFAMAHGEAGEQGIWILTIFRVLARWLNIRGFYREGVQLCENVLKHPACQDDSPQRGDALFLGGVLYDSVCDYTTSMDLQYECLALGERINDQIVQCNALVGLGGRMSRNGNLETAESYLVRACDMMVGRAYKRMLAYATISLMRIRYSRGREMDTTTELRAQLKVLEECGDLRGQAIASMELGTILDQRECIDEAKHYYRRCIALFHMIRHVQGMVNCHRILGMLEWQQGNATGVRSHFADCFRESRNNGDWLSLLLALEVRADQELACGNCETAARLYGAARQARVDMALPLAPEDQRLLQENLAGLETVLGRASLQTQLLLGASLSLDAAIRLALDVITVAPISGMLQEHPSAELPEYVPEPPASAP